MALNSTVAASLSTSLRSVLAEMLLEALEPSWPALGCRWRARAYVATMRTTACFGIVVALVACGHGEAVEPMPQASPNASESQAEEQPQAPNEAHDVPADFDKATHMQAMQAMAMRIRDGVVVGDLPAAKNAAEQFRASLAKEKFEGGFRSYVGRLDVALEDVTIAGNLEQAGRALAAAALACGNCHVYAHGGPRGADVHADLPTQGDETMDERMQRHDVAIEQLWLGLTAPSDEMWLTGGRTLASAPLSPPVHDDKAGMELMSQEVETLRGAAHDIRLADTTIKRADLFGRLLGRCGICHREVEP